MTTRRGWSARGVVTLALLGVALVATGCGHAMSQPMPDMKGRLALKVTKDQPSKATDMPIGVHQIPESPVYISGHQGAAGIGILFGPIGVLAAHAAAQNTGEKKAGTAQDQLRIDMTAAAQRILDEELTRRGETLKFAPAGTAGDGTLEIAPFAVLTFVTEHEVRPWIVLKATLKSASGEEQWKTRYIAGVKETRVLGGDAGWIVDNARPLRDALDRALRTGVSVLLREASGDLKRTGGKPAKVKAHWVWVKPQLELPAEILDESGDVVVVMPKTNDAIVFSGINIFERETVTVTPEAAK